MGLSSFLPSHLVRQLARSRPPAAPCARRLRAALLVSDIAGFTALTDRLQARGREGAEEIAAVVSAVFGAAIHAIESRGGSVQCFGGDALFALFFGAAAVRRAHDAVGAITSAFARHGRMATSAGPIALRVTQALHWGRVTELHLGGGARRGHLVCGPGATAVARLQARGVRGDLHVSRAAQARYARERPSRVRAAPPPAIADGLTRYAIQPRSAY